MFPFDFLFPKEEKQPKDLFLGFFTKINPTELKTKENEFYSKINSETIKLSEYFENSAEKFPSLFDSNLKTFDECLQHLEKIAIPNKCVCAGVIDAIPGFRCSDCSKFENTIYCIDCFKNSQDLHKGHNVVYLSNSIGMCDCGDPLALNTYCHEHSGPFIEQKQIEEYIQKSFGEKVLENLRKFFDEFFLVFSKYFILTEKIELFIEESFNEKFSGELNDELLNEKDDVELLKSNFCIIFQNFIYFLRLITKNNFGMVHLIASYFLKNNFGSLNIENEFMTNHQCIELNQNDIKILSESDKKENHICKCPFLRLFFSNYRDNVKLDSKEDEQQFIFSFVHNLQLRSIYSIMEFFLYKTILYNNNENLIYCRTQFYLDDSLEFMARKTPYLEDSVNELYNYLKIIMKRNASRDNYLFKNEESIKKLLKYIIELPGDIKYYSKTKMRLVMTEKTAFFKKAIDLICLFHNMNEFKSIVPHPDFQPRLFSGYIFETERYLLKIPALLNCCIEWNKIEKLKEIYQYMINKILNQEKEEIKQLDENEFTFHINLYRSFGIFMNAFCFNYSFMNNCTILESINFFKKNFFESQEQVETFVDIILKDLFKFFGFICGTKNNLFNYYERANVYFTIYTEYYCYQNDFTLIKYIFALTEKNIDINSFLKLSNVENIYEKFDDIFNKDIILEDKPNEEKKEENVQDIDINTINNLQGEERDLALLRFLLNRRMSPGTKDKSAEESNIIMQWEMLLKLLIFSLREDSCCYHSLIDIYEEVLSTQTKNDLFNNIKNNKYAMYDLKNLLQEKLILKIIEYGNLIDRQKLEKDMDKYFFNLFDENNIYNQTLDELTYNKMNGETKIYYLKDEYLKYIDCNNYISPLKKSEAQKYILDFKKDIIKTYNYYFYNHSQLTFEFFEKVYEKVLLNKNNLDLIIKIFEKLINKDKILEYLDKASIRNSIFPILLNYLQIFNVINTKSFIEFKLENKNTINKLYNLLFDYIKNNNIDKDLEEQIKQILNQMNIYQLIFDNYNGDLSKLNKYDYNTNIIEKIKLDKKSNTNNINIIPIEKDINNKKKQKIQNIKNKCKLLLKKKSNDFMSKIEKNEELIKGINEYINDVKNIGSKDEEIMCFCCRNPIKLNSFDQPYGKLGLCINDLFYINTIKASLREEFSKLGISDNSKIYLETMKNIKNQIFSRITSCGHYVHNSCFDEGIKKNNEFSCPICLRYQNILIPPLTSFHDKYDFLKSKKIKEFFKEDKEKEEDKKEDENINLFNATVINYLVNINIFKNDIEKYNKFLDDIYPYYKAHLNYFENIFYVNGTTFYKQQQIDNIKNLILSLRLIIHNIKEFDKYDIIKYIKETLLNLAKGPCDNNFLYQYKDSYMYYINLFEKILLSLLILFDYEEIKETLKYILYVFLPYICFGLYFRKLMIEKNTNNINDEQFKQMLELNEVQNYLDNNNEYIMNYLNSFLKKFCLIKIISDYQNKNEDIINNFNEISLNNILSFINMDDLLKNLEQNEIKINNIINILPKIFNSSDVFYELLSPVLNFNKILNSIIENVKKYNSTIIKEISHELIIQFSPVKFNFISLDNNIFDFILKNLEKNCIICNKIEKNSFICLICGEKICDKFSSRKRDLDTISHIKHIYECCVDSCIYMELNSSKLYYIDLREDIKLKLYPLYVDQTGAGPKNSEITNEFNLSKEKLKLTLLNYVCNDFHFK